VIGNDPLRFAKAHAKEESRTKARRPFPISEQECRGHPDPPKHLFAILIFALIVVAFSVGYEYLNDLGRRNGWWWIIFIDTICGQTLNRT
jgi:hypothetical protein